MDIKKQKSCSGVTLIEVTVAMVILTIATLGTMGFRYYSAADAKKADVQATAARLPNDTADLSSFINAAGLIKCCRREQIKNEST